MTRLCAVVLCLFGCEPGSLYSDEPGDSPRPPFDAGTDTFLPPMTDAGPGNDAGPPPPDAAQPDGFVPPIDSGTIADCVYPTGSRGLGGGDVIAPYTWSNARDETGRVFDFSLEDFHCDPAYAEYKSIVLYVGAGWCPSCPQEMRRVDSMSSQLQSERALIVYMEGQDRSYNDATSASAADFVESVIGVSSPGIRIGDGESSEPMAIFRTLRTVPSGFFIRRSDMTIVAAGPESGTLRYDDLAREANVGGPDPEPPPPPPTCMEEPGEPNDAPEAASPLSGTTIGGLCNANPDYFVVNVAGSWRVDLTFSHAQGDLDLYVIDGSSRVASSDSTTDNESVSYSGPAVVEVIGYRGATAAYQNRADGNVMRFVFIAVLLGCQPAQLTSVGGLNDETFDAATPTDVGPGTDAATVDAGASDGGFDATLPPPDADKPAGDMCGDTRTTTFAFRGTPEPSVTPISPEQVLAIGSISGCSATLITPTWVLTATHCGARVGGNFCMGSEPSRPDRCVRIARVLEAPGYNARVQFDHDLTLLELAQDAREVAPGVVPIPIYTDTLVSTEWAGQMVEMAGYGRTETGSSGTRFFAPMRVTEINSAFVRMEGMGRGTCYGDSGGPVLFVAGDGTVRVAGDASHLLGSPPTCGETAQYTRTDIHRDWIEGHTGPTVIEGAPCGEVSAEGQCNGDRAVYCAGDELQVDVCDTCGWDPSVEGFRCITGADPCAGLDTVGECSGATARWCERGVVKERDCGACDQTCGRQGGVHYCVDDPCMGLDYLGRCTGDVAEWCEDGEFRSTDCAPMGQSCGWINDTYGYYCQ